MTADRVAWWAMVLVGLAGIAVSTWLPVPFGVLVALAAGLLAAMGILLLVMPQ